MATAGPQHTEPRRTSAPRHARSTARSSHVSRWPRRPAYIAGQLAGSLAGVMLGRAVLGAVVANPAVGYTAIQPAAGWPGSAAFAGEALSLAVLMAFVVAFLDRPALMRWTPAVVATGVAVLIFAGGLMSGGSFNPARQLGPLPFAGRLTYLWAYLLGPLAGGLILVLALRALGLRRFPAGDGAPACPRPAPGTHHRRVQRLRLGNELSHKT